MQFSSLPGDRDEVAIDHSRGSLPNQQTLFGTLVVDLAARTAIIGPLHVLLSSAEVAILCILIGRRNTPMPREVIVQALCEGGMSISPRMIDVHICRLQRKLASLGHGAIITTAWGRGYLAGTPPRDDVAPGEPLGGGSIAALVTA